MNRTIEPEIKLIETVTLPAVEKIQLDNGVPVYSINAGEQDVVKIEFLFKAGKWYEDKNLVADFTNRLLREGTINHDSREIADLFDYYGTNINYGAGFETAGAVLYSLTSQIENVLPLMGEIFSEAVFPEKELHTAINNRKQRLKVDLEKNDFIANRNFVDALFGQKHPYGRVTEFADFDVISPDDLKAFYKNHYNASNLALIISGKYDAGLLSLLNKYFGSKTLLGPKASETLSYPIEASKDLILHTEKSDSVQSAIAVGNLTINKFHPDFLKLSLLNTVFGGYFGSRLMSNIREEKGYTYGIYSSFVSYPHSGFLEISAEVGKEVRQATLDEIQKEINILRSELIPEDELQIVKNYMSGKILRSLDGALKFSETLKGLIIYGQDTDYIIKLLQTVRETGSEELLRLANQYYDFDKMYKVTVG